MSPVNGNIAVHTITAPCNVMKIGEKIEFTVLFSEFCHSGKRKERGENQYFLFSSFVPHSSKLTSSWVKQESAVKEDERCSCQERHRRVDLKGITF